MMGRIKRLFCDLIAGAVAVLLLCLAITAPYQVEVHATAPGPMAYTAPSDGAGRVEAASNPRNTLACVETCVETSVDTPETETAENEPYIAPQEIIETEAEFAEDIYVPDTEEYIEVLPDLDPIIETDIDALIVQVAAEYGLPWQLVSAVCYAESNYNPYAVSSTPDYGLMQITESVLDAYGLTDWSDPAQNLDVGCRILREKMDLSDGDATQALTRYRFGDAEALRMWGRGEWSNWYTDRVLSKYYELIREG